MPQNPSYPQASSEPLNSKQIQNNLHDEILIKKKEKAALEKEFFQFSKRGIRKKVDLLRKTEVEEELTKIEKTIGQMKNNLRMMKIKSREG